MKLMQTVYLKLSIVIVNQAGKFKPAFPQVMISQHLHFFNCKIGKMELFCRVLFK